MQGQARLESMVKRWKMMSLCTWVLKCQKTGANRRHYLRTARKSQGHHPNSKKVMNQEESEGIERNRKKNQD